MAGDGASQIKPEQVIAAIGDRTQKMELLATRIAEAERFLACERERKAALSAELSDLTIVLDGVTRGDGASQIKPEQVIAAIGDRTQKMELLATRIASSERALALVRKSKAALSAELSDLTIVLDGVTRGDLAFMEEIPERRLDELLAARTDRNPRLGGVPLTRRQIELAREAFSSALASGMPAPRPARAQEAEAAAAAAAASGDLARLQI